MGSLVGGWDSHKPGGIPKGFEDYKEPYTPRGSRRSASREEPRLSSGDLDKPARAPSLERTSCPPIHGASAIQHYLSRASQSGTSVPTTPREPGSPRSKQAKLTLRIGDTEEELAAPLQAKEKWCSRVDSASLNLRPDEVDSESWRHGSFKLDEAICHTMHIHIPHSPTAAQQQAVAPVTPPAATGAQEAAPKVAARLPVTVSRMPREAEESFRGMAL